MRVMVLGAGGMLGHDLVATAPTGIELTALNRAQLDLTNRNALEEKVTSVRPGVIINAAAYTAVDRAESEREEAFRVNAEAVGELGRIATAVGARVVHFSTDYVFDGEATEPYAEDAPTNPINVYGASKLAGEQALAASGAEHLVIRTQWLFGLHGRSFPRTMWDRATARQRTKVVDDQRGRPTFTDDVARATWLLLQRRERGLVHTANEGTATWYQVARRVFDRAGAADLLEPCRTADYPTVARRPSSSVLDLSRFRRTTGTGFASWEDALDRVLEQLKSTKGGT